MTAPTRPATASELLADAHARLLGAGIVMADALIAAQNEHLSCEPLLRAIHHELLAVADRQNDALEKLGPPAPPKLELLPGGLGYISHGLCRYCGRIGDHGASCPEVSS